MLLGAAQTPVGGLAGQGGPPPPPAGMARAGSQAPSYQGPGAFVPAREPRDKDVFILQHQQRQLELLARLQAGGGPGPAPVSIRGGGGVSYSVSAPRFMGAAAAPPGQGLAVPPPFPSLPRQPWGASEPAARAGGAGGGFVGGGGGLPLSQPSLAYSVHARPQQGRRQEAPRVAPSSGAGVRAAGGGAQEEAQRGALEQMGMSGDLLFFESGSAADLWLTSGSMDEASPVEQPPAGDELPQTCDREALSGIEPCAPQSSGSAAGGAADGGPGSISGALERSCGGGGLETDAQICALQTPRPEQELLTGPSRGAAHLQEGALPLQVGALPEMSPASEENSSLSASGRTAPPSDAAKGPLAALPSALKSALHPPPPAGAGQGSVGLEGKEGSAPIKVEERINPERQKQLKQMIGTARKKQQGWTGRVEGGNMFKKNQEKSFVESLINWHKEGIVHVHQVPGLDSSFAAEERACKRIAVDGGDGAATPVPSTEGRKLCVELGGTLLEICQSAAANQMPHPSEYRITGWSILNRDRWQSARRNWFTGGSEFEYKQSSFNMCLRHMGFRPTKSARYGGSGFDWDNSLGFIFDMEVRNKYSSKKRKNASE